MIDSEKQTSSYPHCRHVQCSSGHNQELRLEWKVNMNGAQIKASDNRQIRAMMRLYRKNSDASKRKPGMKALSESVAPLIVGAGSQACHLVHVANASQLQWPALRTNTCALIG